MVELGLGMWDPVDMQHAVLERHRLALKGDDSLDGELSPLGITEHDEVADRGGAANDRELVDDDVIAHL